MGSDLKILAVTSHPGEAEVGCFGTLDACVKRGDRVVVCALTGGELGHLTLGREELERIRLVEGAKGSGVIGAHYTNLGFPDREVDSSSSEQTAALTSLIRSVRPDIIFTHSLADGDHDHCQTNSLVLKCSRLALLSNHGSAFPPIGKAPVIYYMESPEGGELKVDTYVDITSSFEHKIKALGEHASQHNFILDDTVRDLVHFIEVLGGYRGWQCNVRMAEAFALCPGRTQITSRLLP